MFFFLNCKRRKIKEQRRKTRGTKFHLLLSLLLSLLSLSQNAPKKKKLFYLSGMNLDDVVDPIPAFPCFTGLYEIENSPR